MTLEEFDPESVDEEDPRIQAIIFPNPHNEEMEKYIKDKEQAEELYVAARWLKNRLGDESSTVVGKFIQAVIEAEKKNNYEELEELMKSIKGEDDT